MLCRKCGAQFEGYGIYCPKCANPAPVVPEQKKVKRNEPKTSQAAVRKAANSSVFLAALCLVTAVFIIGLFATVPYLNSIDALFKNLGADNFLNRVAPGVKFTVFLGMIPTLLIASGLWVLYFSVKKNASIGADSVGFLKIAVVVKYIYSLTALAFSTLAVFFLSVKWVGVFKDIGFSHLLVLGVVAAAGIRLVVTFFAVRIASESLRNIGEAERALRGKVGAVNISLSPVKLTIVTALLNLCLAALTKNWAMIFYTVTEIISAVMFGIISVKFKSFVKSDL